MSPLKATDSCYSRRRLSTPFSVTQCNIISVGVIVGPGDYFAGRVIGSRRAPLYDRLLSLHDALAGRSALHICG